MVRRGGGERGAYPGAGERYCCRIKGKTTAPAKKGEGGLEREVVLRSEKSEGILVFTHVGGFEL